MNLREQISRIQYMMSLLKEQPEDFTDEFGNEYKFNFDRPNLDINKLVDVGAVFVTLAVEGNPNSPDFGKPIEGQGNSILSLENYEKSLKKSVETGKEDWVKIAVENYQTTPNESDQQHLDNTYEGKIKQILRSLEKLGIDLESVKKN